MLIGSSGRIVGKGYEVLDENGTVKCPRQLTAAEMDDQALVARLKQDAVVARDLPNGSCKLLRYSTDDIGAAHQRALSELKIDCQFCRVINAP